MLAPPISHLPYLRHAVKPFLFSNYRESLAREMTVDTRPQTLPFSIQNAFTDRLGGGNPAVIVHLPSLTALPDEKLQTIATNFNQPITVFITPLASEGSNSSNRSSSSTADNNDDPSASTGRYGIRWFTTAMEVPLCGHGTLAAAATLFRSSGAGENLTEIRFEATSGRFLVARKVEEDRVEIDLDSERSEALSAEEDVKMREVLAKALGKDVPVKYTGRGSGHLNMYALVEVDTTELKTLKVNTDAFLESSFGANVVVARSSVPGVTFESRVFAPCAGVAEDPVCGTAHTLSTPYWMKTNKLSGVVYGRQVSAREGDLRILLDEDEGRIKLGGRVRTVCRGEVYV